MIDIKTGKEIENPAVLKAPLAGAANANVARGMMRGVGARNAAMFGEKKPYDSEVEWVGVDHGVGLVNPPYVNTGVVIGSRNDFVISCRAYIEPYLWANIFASYNGENAQATRIISANGSYSSIYCGYRRVASYQNYVNCDLAKVHRYELSYMSVKIDDSQPIQISEPSGDINTLDVKIFGRQENTYRANTKVYSFRIDDAEGVVIDLIPVRIGTEGCFYDNVSGKIFRNVGSGNLTKGSDV